MSCNGCRILRKGCNENCILRQSLIAIEGSQAQANATVFVAKFFGRAGLMSFLSSVSESQRSTLFQSLLFEACGRTVNPVNGAVGLLWTGNWEVCQSAVETVLNGGVLQTLQESYELTESTKVDDGSEAKRTNLYASKDLNARFKIKRKGFDDGTSSGGSLGFAARMTAGGRLNRKNEKRRQDSPSDESETTTLESGFVCHQDLQQSHETKLLKLFF